MRAAEVGTREECSVSSIETALSSAIGDGREEGAAWVASRDIMEAEELG